MKVFAIILIFLGLLGCASSSEKGSNQYQSADGDRPLVDAKYSLAADREALNEMRSQVPEDKKKQNDEMAYLLGLFANPEKSPSEIRQQFDTLVRKKRGQFDKDITRERENFNKSERKKREDFLKEQKQVRDDFNKTKQDRDKKSDFYRDQDQKRSEYFADERDRRNDFESDVRERRKNFEDYVREKTTEFNQEHRAFSKRQEELKKEKKKPKVDPAAAELEQGLQDAKSKPGTFLESGE